MAKSYLDIQNSAYTVGNIMDWTNALTRLSGVPVDITSVYGSYKDAVIYAAENAVAYEGQVISVTENGIATIYVVTPENLGTYTVGEGEAAKNYTVHIKEVGTAPVGDEQSIDVTDGVITLHGFEAAANATLPQKTPVYKMNGEDYVLDENNERVIDHYEINWVAIDAIVQGDGNTKSVVTAGSSNVTVSSNYNSDSDTYTYSISVAEQEIPDVPEYAIKKLETPSTGSQATYKLTKDGNEVDVAIEIPAFPVITHPEYTIVKETRAEGATETVYHLAKDGEEVTTDIVVPDAYDDTALAGRVAAVENFFKTADGETLDAALDTLIEIQKYIDEDGEVAEQVLANKQAIEVLNGSDSTAGSVANAIKVASSNLSSQITVVDTKASNAQKDIDAFKEGHSYTDEQVDEAISGAITAANLGQYAKASDVQDALDDKQDKITSVTISHTDDTHSESFTLSSGNLALVIDAYSKSETEAKIAEKVASVTGGENAAAVKLALESHRAAIDKEIWGEGAAAWTTTVTETVDGETVTRTVYTPVYSSDSRLDILEAASSTHSSQLAILTGAATQAGSVAEAKKVADDAYVLASNTSSNLSVLDEKVTGTNGLTARIAVLEQFDKDHKQNYTDLVEVVNNKANSANVYTKSETETKISDAIDALNITQYAKTADVYTKTAADTATSNAISGAIAALEIGKYITSTQSSNDIEAAIEALSTNIANTYITSTQSSNDIAAAISGLGIGNYYTKTEADTAFMTQAEVDARINALIAAADPEDDGNTITNIQNLVEYVENHGSDITGIINAIGVKGKAAEGTPDTEGYVPAVTATGLYAEIDTALASANAYTDALALRVSANETAISSTIPAAIEAAAEATSSNVLAEVSTKYVTADAENNLSLNGQTIVLCGGNASSGAASAE